MSNTKKQLVPADNGRPQVAVKPRVRERILHTASRLFYQRGIRAVGVDAIASAAGTNKMSFYRNFASKDDLVVAYLLGEQQLSWQRWEAAAGEYSGNPRVQIEALFEALTNACQDSCRGCAMSNAAVEITEMGHPALPIIEQCKAELQRRFRHLAREMSAREPDFLGDALMLLWEGSYLACLTLGSHGPVRSAAKAARALIAAYSD